MSRDTNDAGGGQEKKEKAPRCQSGDPTKVGLSLKFFRGRLVSRVELLVRLRQIHSNRARCRGTVASFRASRK